MEKEKKIPRVLLFCFLGVLAAVLLGGTWFLRTQETYLLKKIAGELRAVAALKSEEISNWRRERLADAAVLTDTDLFRVEVPRLLEYPGSDPAKIVRRFQVLAEHYHYDDILLLDPAGNVRLSLTGASGALHPEGRAALEESWRSGQAAITDLHRDTEKKQIHIGVAAPLLTPGGKPAGAVILQADARQFLFPLIQTWPAPSNTAETLLVRKEGDEVVFLNDLRHRDGAALELRFSLEEADLPAARAVREGTGFYQGRDYRGVPVLAAFLPVSGSSWVMISKVDEAEALSPWRTRALLILGLILALVLLAGAAAGMVWQSNRKAHYRSRLETQEAMHKLSSRLEAVLKAVPDIIMETDLDKVYTWANKAGVEFFGADVLGRDAAYYFEGEQETYGLVRPLFAGEQDLVYVESWQRRRDGEKRLLGWCCRPLKDESGRVTGALSSARDITEARLAENEIRRLNAELEDRVAQRTAQLAVSNRELEAFAYSVSHDLRAPLRAVEGFSRILLDDFAPGLGDEGSRLIGVIRANTLRMDRLITDLLELSRAGRAEMKYSRVQMTALARAAFAQAAPPEIPARFEFSLGELPEARGDPALLRQVWDNLLSNAVKYTAPRELRRIEVLGERKGAEVLYRVRDTGVGFDPRYAPKLFGVFQRLHTTAEFPGTGIGLAIVKRIVERHGGRVEAEGRPGEGAEFRFYLPVRTPEG